MSADTLLAAFKDPAVSELMVNDDGSVYVEKAGAKLERLPGQAAAADVQALLTAMVGEGEAFGPGRPYADLSAADGSRVHVIAPPLVRGGVCVTVRKRPTRRPALDELVKIGALTAGCAGFLKYAVEVSKNILFVGGASSGKTTLLNSLAACADPAERILVLEDTPEIVLAQPHVVYMKTRLRDPGGRADITLRDLLVNSLRMRPDRLIVGECRSTEAADLLQAMNVGHDGVMATLHANSAREGLQRLETLFLMSGIDIPLRAVRQNILQAVHLVVFMARLHDGARKVAQVAEVTGMEMDTLTMSDLYRFDARKGPGGAPVLAATGSVPRFYEGLRAQGLTPPLEFFQKS